MGAIPQKSFSGPYCDGCRNFYNPLVQLPNSSPLFWRGRRLSARKGWIIVKRAELRRKIRRHPYQKRRQNQRGWDGLPAFSVTENISVWLVGGVPRVRQSIKANNLRLFLK